MEINKIILVFVFVFLVANVSAVIISEVMYAPNFNEYYNEWIEIYNDGPDIDLTNWTLCGKTLSAGYIDYADSQLKLNNTRILSAGSYAIITDGGSGTEVYSNFIIDAGSIALHVDASTLCTGLSNSGDSISLEDDSGVSIDSMSYDPNLGALDNDNSLQFNGTWCEALPTPGIVNSCPGSGGGNQQSNVTVEETTNATSNETVNNEGGGNETNVSESVPQTSSTGNTVQEKEEEPEIIILNPNTKDIKSEETTKKLDKNDYVKYGLIGFGVLLALLFLLKGKINKKEYKNEFRN